MIAVYSDSQICDLEWISAIRWPSHHVLYHDLEEYRHAPGAKIAFTGHRLHVQHDREIDFEQKVRLLSDHSQAVFSLESELHAFHWNIWNRCHRPNVYWLLPGHVNDRDEIDRNIIFWGDWFKTTASVYRALPQKLNEIDTHIHKTRRFDALLGSPKPHRQFVHDSVIANGLQDKFVMTYGGQWSDQKFYAEDYFIWEPGTRVVDPDNHRGTMDWASYEGHLCHLSQVIPIAVYNQTSFSIVAETDCDNTLSFFSEKTAKPIIAKRLFVVFSGYRFLHNLRRLGFRTFSGIIDESYDEIVHNGERWQQAFDQVIRLCDMDLRTVQSEIADITQHNFDIIMRRDWTRYALDRVQTVIDSVTRAAQA